MVVAVVVVGRRREGRRVCDVEFCLMGRLVARASSEEKRRNQEQGKRMSKQVKLTDSTHRRAFSFFNFLFCIFVFFWRKVVCLTQALLCLLLHAALSYMYNERDPSLPPSPPSLSPFLLYSFWPWLFALDQDEEEEAAAAAVWW